MDYSFLSHVNARNVGVTLTLFDDVSGPEGIYLIKSSGNHNSHCFFVVG